MIALLSRCGRKLCVLSRFDLWRVIALLSRGGRKLFACTRYMKIISEVLNIKNKYKVMQGTLKSRPNVFFKRITMFVMLLGSKHHQSNLAPNVGLMLTHRRRHWSNINPTWCKRLAFAGNYLHTNAICWDNDGSSVATLTRNYTK